MLPNFLMQCIISIWALEIESENIETITVSMILLESVDKLLVCTDN